MNTDEARASDRRWKLIGRGAVTGLSLGAVSGSLFAGLGELLYDAVPAFPYFIGGAVFGAIMGTLCGFLAAVLSLAAEMIARRWPGSLRTALVGAAALTGTMLPFTAVLGNDLLDVRGTWLAWAAGLAAVALAPWFLRRLPADAGGADARRLPGPPSP